MWGECGGGAEKYQFVSRQVANKIKLSESAEGKIYSFLIKSAVSIVIREWRASAEPVRYTSASQSTAKHFSTAQWVGVSAEHLRLR